MQNNLINDRITEYFKQQEQCNKDILYQLTLYIYSWEETNESDLYHMAKIIPHEYLDKLINYCDGVPPKLPSKEEFRHKYLVANCFFLKEILGYNWQKIKEILNIPENDINMLSSISIGHRISRIKDSLTKDLKKQLENNVNIEEFIVELKKTNGK